MPTFNATVRRAVEALPAAERFYMPLIFLACFALVLWAAPRGFDVTDEGYHVYFFSHPDEQLTTTLAQYFRVVAALTPESWANIITYRVVKVLGLVALAVGFSLAFRAWLRDRYPSVHAALPSWAVTVSFIGAGTLLAYGHGPQTLSYNDITTFCFVGAAALVLLLSRSRGSGRGVGRDVAALGIGLLVVVQAFTKPPSALMLLVILPVLALAATPPKEWRSLIRPLVVSGVGLAGFTFFLTDLGVGALFKAKALAEAFEKPIPHMRLLEVMWLYVLGFADVFPRAFRLNHFTYLIYAFIVLSVVLAVRKARTPQGRVSPWLEGAPAILLGLFLVVSAAKLIADQAGIYTRMFLAEVHVVAMATLGMAMILNRAAWSKWMDGRLIFMGLALVAVPFAAGAGTLNYLNVQIILHMAPVFAAIILGTVIVASATGARGEMALLRGVLAVLVLVQLFGALALQPYRLISPLWAQTERLEAPVELAGLSVSPEAARFMESLRQAAAPAGPNPLVLSLYDMPGLPLVLGGTAYGVHWYIGLEAWQENNCIKLRDVAPGAVPDVILLNGEIAPPFLSCMVEQGIALQDYREVADIPNPYPSQETKPVRVLLRERLPAGQ
jgi:hypothetical protein